MTISDVLKAVGDDRILVQSLAECLTNITTNKKGVSRITFETREATANDFMRGTNRVGLVVWIERSDWEEKARGGA